MTKPLIHLMRPPHPLSSSSNMWRMSSLLLFTVVVTLLMRFTPSTILQPVEGVNLQIGMRASWNSTSIALEASQFFTEPAAYFQFLTQLNTQLSTSSIVSDQLQYTTSLALASSMLGASSLQTFRSSLILRAASPAVETFATMRRNRIIAEVSEIGYDQPNAQEIKDEKEAKWNECDTLIAIGGSLVCDVKEIDWNLLNGDDQEAVQEFDHIFPTSDVSSPATLVLYADPLRPSFARAHEAIVSKLATSSFRYVLRPVIVHFSSANSQQPLFVQGFGVEMAIKNMEYKVLDDSKIEYSGDSSNNVELPEEMGGEGAQDVSGFYFDTLLARRPELARELEAFKTALLKEQHDIGDKKVAVWDMKDLGFQASQRVLGSKPELQLEVLRDLSQNFPMYAQALTKTKLNNTIKASIERNCAGSGRQHLPPAGSNYLDLNGKLIDLGANGDEIEIYNMITLLKQEAESIDELSQLSFQPSSLQKVLSTNLGPAAGSDDGDGQFLLNMDANSPETKRILTWLNDIQSDARYRPWPQSLQEYLQPGWPNQLKYVRKNCYSGIMIIDPAHSKALDFLTQAQFFVENNAPIRLGFVFWIPPVSSAIGSVKLGTWNSDLINKNGVAAWEALIGDDDDLADDSASEIYGTIQAVIAKIYYYILTEGKGSKKELKEVAFDFLANLHESNTNRAGPVRMDEVKAAWKSVQKRAGFGSDAPKLKKILNMAEMNELVQLNYDYVSSRGFVPDADTSHVGQMPLMVVNGQIHVSSMEKSFREVLMGAILPEQQRITMMVYRGEISDRTKDIHEVVQSKPNVFPRINKAITASLKDMTFVKTLPSVTETSRIQYWISPDPDNAQAVNALTYWLVADWQTFEGLSYVEKMLEYLKKGHGELKSRVAFFHNAKQAAASSGGYSATATSDHYLVGRLASALTHSAPTNLEYEQRFELLQKIVMLGKYFFSDQVKLRKALELLLDEEKLSSFKSILGQTNSEVNNGRGLNPDITPAFLSTLAASGANVLVVNGRILALDSSEFQQFNNLLQDYKLLSTFSASSWSLPTIERLLSNPDIVFEGEFAKKASDPTWKSEVLMRISYVLTKRTIGSGAGGVKSQQMQQPNQFSQFPSLDSSNTAGMIRYENPASLLNIRVLLDPLCKLTQKLVPVLIVLRDLYQPNLQIWLSPRSGITEFPIKRFYRYAVGSSLNFDEVTGELKQYPGTLFRNLRTKHILSTVMFTPESWNIGLEKSSVDLDNINVADLDAASGPAVINIQYHLQHLLMFGQCFDLSRGGEPPAGLQLMIGNPSVPFQGDTLVMANLGYFQLKANPGEWTLEVANEKHAEIYEIQPAGSGKALAASHGKKGTRQIFIRSFNEGFLRLDVLRRPGQESVQLLDPARLKKHGKKKSGSLWSSVFGSSDSGTAAVATSSKSNRTGETIHIFSLASGHLYERFLKIMMLSVLNSTKNPVKFWFLQNFASPQFVEFVPQMAKHYGFEAEFVTYKWPAWLRRQEEKQRIIWGYKILFLDVLFPLAVPRIIYIDADQVVRGDILELWNLDLEGAPYAYTPFCDSNQETEGFRFWKQGYWRDHLRGKPYHISALYVVDLDQFRLLRAGDSLRGIYDQLSADPNSLANLDQDLPNYAQHMVPIFSLPQQWLWCQTWCSMDTLSQAKTIDLCNNPLTKTPKLDVAKQLLPEWPGLDQQAKALEPIFANNQQQQQTTSQGQGQTDTTATHRAHDEL